MRGNNATPAVSPGSGGLALAGQHQGVTLWLSCLSNIYHGGPLYVIYQYQQKFVILPWTSLEKSPMQSWRRCIWMTPVCKSEPSCLSFEEDQNVGCCLPGIQILHLVSVPTKFSFKCLSENTLVVSNFLMLTSVAGVQTKQMNWRLSQIWSNVF